MTLTVVVVRFRVEDTLSDERPEEEVGRLNALLATAAEQAREQKGQVDRLGGDAVIALFSEPALEDARERALAAIRAAQLVQKATQHDASSGRSVRIGVQTGAAIVGRIGLGELQPRTAVGGAVEEAAWLSMHAPPGEILIGEAALAEVHDEVAAQAAGSYALPSGGEPIVAFRLGGAREAEAPDDRYGLVGKELAGRYRIERWIGSGASASVFLATSKSTGGRVAVKVLHAHLEEANGLGRRFEQEVRAVAALSHVNTVRVIDFGRDGRRRFLAMEYLDGTRLADLPLGAGLEWRRAAHITRQILRALDEAHRAGIIHRDIKPANVVILDEPGQRDFVKVVDFGVARVSGMTTDTPRPIGTPSHIAPELWQGREIGPAADLYSTGCLLYELLTGVPPFRSAEVPRLGILHVYQSPPALPEGVPDELAALCYALLEKEPRDRPASAGDAADRLDALLESPGPRKMAARPAPRAVEVVLSETLPESAELERITTGGSRRRALLALVALSVPLIAVAVFLWRMGGEPERAPVREPPRPAIASEAVPEYPRVAPSDPATEPEGAPTLAAPPAPPEANPPLRGRTRHVPPRARRRPEAPDEAPGAPTTATEEAVGVTTGSISPSEF